ncbi:asparagine synthase (glutamine-hydrolyzing) [Synechococcus sp. A15-127]|nr:asparagine synthase (glutamine-hydrolyzing) [Synechococcus sp. A15-127]
MMAAAIAYRGPDDSGAWVDPAVGLALVHRRLAILDLSPAGHQPMPSASGRYVIVFNGEIYNHLALRQELPGPWRGYSDTETLLAAIEAWGLEAALQRCAGMFALALWDRREQLLQLARDRFGEKPLYWGLSGSGSTGSGAGPALVFASELAALRAWPGFDNPIDRPSLAQLLRFGAIAAPRCIHSGIQQLLPGHLLRLPLGAGLPEPLPVSQPWWCLRSTIAESLAHPFADQTEALDALQQALGEAVQHQSLADVPLGSFLSGGIDSSLITALLQARSSRPVRTFTIGFEESGFNEAPYARAVAAYLGTEHNETLLTAADAQALIPRLPRLYSEPFADSSQLPTHLVCREARRNGLTVALSGDGGDELFGGYNRYLWGPRIWNRLAWLPFPLRRSLSLLIRSLPPAGWDAVGRPLPIHQLGHKAHKLAERLQYVRSTDDLYRSLVSEWRDPAFLLQPDSEGSLIQEPTSPLDWPLPEALSADPLGRMMATDSLNYLPNDILTKVDRSAMATSLETRSPFLDHHVAEVAWRLPMDMKIHPSKRGGTSKWALRQILYKYVPRELIERPKAGFGMPIGQWLRGPLRGWAEDLLEPRRMLNQGYLRPEPIQTLWSQHLSGRFDHTTRLWTVLMWQAWLEEWG